MKRTDISMKIHPAGAFLLAAAVLLLDVRKVLAASTALVMHEGAHLIAMRLCGIKECTIELTPFGGMADVAGLETYPAWKQMLCSAAGVAESAVMAGLCLCFAPRTIFWHAFFDAHFSLAFINLMPAWPLDGARILTAIAAGFGLEYRIKKFLSWFSIILSIGLVGLGLYGIWYGAFNPSLLVAGPYLCYAAYAEDVASKVRRLEYAGNKLASGGILPVKLWVGSKDRAKRDNFGVLLSRMEHGKYHMFIQIDEGQITKMWTEEEMQNYVFDRTRKRQTESMDKEYWL